MSPSDELTALKYELQQVEARIRADLRAQNVAWQELAGKALLLIARMILAIASREQAERPATMLAAEALPIPGFEPRPIDVQEYYRYAPEKFELIGGYLFDDAEHPDARRRLLALLLVNMGLVEAVSLAPRERWLEAMERS